VRASRGRMALRGVVASILVGGVLMLGSETPHAATQLAGGTFLVARRGLPDPNFTKSVVLLLAYGPRGAVGLIINGPTDQKLSDLLPQIDGLGGMVYGGGPVAGNSLMMLARAGGPLEDSVRVFADVHVSRSPELLKRLAEDRKGKKSIRVYAGHAAWAPGQLDHEVARGDWHIIPADADTVFAREPSGIWREVLPRDPLLWTMTLP